MNIEDIEVGKKYYIRPWSTMPDIHKSRIYEKDNTHVLISIALIRRKILAKQVITKVKPWWKRFLQRGIL